MSASSLIFYLTSQTILQGACLCRSSVCINTIIHRLQCTLQHLFGEGVRINHRETSCREPSMQGIASIKQPTPKARGRQGTTGFREGIQPHEVIRRFGQVSSTRSHTPQRRQSSQATPVSGLLNNIRQVLEAPPAPAAAGSITQSSMPCSAADVPRSPASHLHT